MKTPEALLRADPKTLTRLILFAVRFMFTARTGDVGRNDAAVEHFAAANDSGSAKLARLALVWRDAAPAPSDTAAVEAIAAGLVPLYDEFLRDHETRLRDYGRSDLAESFRDWRIRLLER